MNATFFSSPRANIAAWSPYSGESGRALCPYASTEYARGGAGVPRLRIGAPATFTLRRGREATSEAVPVPPSLSPDPS